MTTYESIIITIIITTTITTTTILIIIIIITIINNNHNNNDNNNNNNISRSSYSKQKTMDKIEVSPIFVIDASSRMISIQKIL